MYLIQRGQLSIRKKKGHGYVEVGRVCANEVVGELSFFDQAPRSASAIAVTEVEFVEIPFESLEKIYASVPAYLKTIVSAMADRLRKADDLIRRLQKDTIRDHTDGGDPTATESPTAEDVVAAAAAMDIDSIKKPDES